MSQVEITLLIDAIGAEIIGQTANGLDQLRGAAGNSAQSLNTTRASLTDLYGGFTIVSGALHDNGGVIQGMNDLSAAAAEGTSRLQAMEKAEENAMLTQAIRANP